MIDFPKQKIVVAGAGRLVILFCEGMTKYLLFDLILCLDKES